MANDDSILTFSELLQQSRSRVYGLIHAIVLNDMDAQDLFQQTAIVLWEKFGDFQPGTDFTAWALQVARFKSINFVRQRRREQDRLSDVAVECLYQASLAAPEDMGDARLDALKGCMAKLSTADRSFLVKCYDGKSQVKDVAEQLGRSPGAAYGALHRIRKALLECIRRQVSMQDHPNQNLA
jgi:RNA polymerase sigma-70 factor, ECF subfamily